MGRGDSYTVGLDLDAIFPIQTTCQISATLLPDTTVQTGQHRVEMVIVMALMRSYLCYGEKSTEAKKIRRQRKFGSSTERQFGINTDVLQSATTESNFSESLPVNYM